MNEDVKKAITSRRSVRKFLSTEISKDVIEDILSVSARAPSGTNIQPWNVHVLLGESKSKVCKASCDAFYDPKIEKKNERIHYMEDFREPYLARRRKVGWYRDFLHSNQLRCPQILHWKVLQQSLPVQSAFDPVK